MGSPMNTTTHTATIGLRPNPEPETPYTRALRQMVEDQLNEEARISAIARQRELEGRSWLDETLEVCGTSWPEFLRAAR